MSSSVLQQQESNISWVQQLPCIHALRFSSTVQCFLFPKTSDVRSDLLAFARRQAAIYASCCCIRFFLRGPLEHAQGPDGLPHPGQHGPPHSVWVFLNRQRCIAYG